MPITRFINILGEVESEKSLNARALKIGLPEFVVDTRHQISHGSSLPSLDVLRISVESLLKWLKTSYWDMERDAIKDLALPLSVSLLEEKLTQLLNINIYLQEESSHKTDYVRDMRNDVEKKKVLKIGNLLYLIYIKELRTWETTPMPTLGVLYDSKTLLNLTIPTAIVLVVETIKPYFEHEMDSAVKIFVNYLLQDDATEGKCIERWKPLLLALHALGQFPSLLNRLVDCVCSANSGTSVNAAKWTILLLRSLLKRFKVQQKLDLMSRTSIPSSKRIKLNLTEREKILTEDRIKHQLSTENGTRESYDVMSLQFTIQLQDPKLLTGREISQLSRKLLFVPKTSAHVISYLLLKLKTNIRYRFKHKHTQSVQEQTSDPADSFRFNFYGAPNSTD